MENQNIRLIPADLSLAPAVTAYYLRNREFLEEFEPSRTPEFFTEAYQRSLLSQEILNQQNSTGFRFYIVPTEEPEKIIGAISLSNVVWGAFRSAHLGYKLDHAYLNRGYMTAAVELVTAYAFQTLKLHRIEANIMPRNLASLRVVEKNGYQPEGLAKAYLKIHGVWEDHIHMVKLNSAE